MQQTSDDVDRPEERSRRRTGLRRFLPLAGAAAGAALVLFLAYTCSSSSEPVNACATPEAGSAAAGLLAQTRAQARFAVLYPCTLPAGQRLASSTLTGEPGRQRAELVFDGPFDLTVRQSQVPPPVAPDPAGASRVIVNLSPNVPATLIERNDGSRRALYHLFWEDRGLFYEVQAVGPPLQRRTILLVATSLQ